MKKIHKNRLLKVANFILNLDAKKFDLEEIIASSVKTDSNSNKILNECGTVGCAIGWCPCVFPRSVGVKYFYEAGLSFEGKRAYVYRVFDKKNPDETYYVDFASSFFGISSTDAEYLFNPAAYHKSKRGPKSVANRIFSFIRNNGKVNTCTKAYTLQY